jgi:hypothetical protein
VSALDDARAAIRKSEEAQRLDESVTPLAREVRPLRDALRALCDHVERMEYRLDYIDPEDLS